MGDVEIVIKVPKGVPKEVVEKALRKSVKEIEEIRKFYGAVEPKIDVEKLVEEADSAWTE